MRLDKFLCDNLDYSRSEIKKCIKSGEITVNNEVVKDPGFGVANEMTVTFKGTVIEYCSSRIFCLNKPSGYVTANNDSINKYVMQLINEPNIGRLSPVGRLDKDTTGLLIITDDGKLAHELISPSRHVSKTYLVGIEHGLSEDDIALLEHGVDIGDDKPTKPASVRVLSSCQIELTITEGRYHQVKRMLESVNNKVISLKRISFGRLELPPDLPEGKYIKIKREDIC